MNWYKVMFQGHASPRWCYGEDGMSAMAASELLGTGLSYTIDQCDAGDVPAVRRGLTEATVEQIRNELKRRGWKLRLS